MNIETNKIAGAAFGTLLFVVGLNILSGIVFTPHPAGDRGYALPLPEATEGAAPAAAAKEEPLPVLLAKADPAKGEAAAKKCHACHDFTKGGPNKVGPNLWGVVGRPKASHPGFNYSAAMKAKGGDWTYDDIFQFIHNPKQYVPGTIMAFAGIGSAEERANVLAYLHTLSDNPVPFPAAQ